MRDHTFWHSAAALSWMQVLLEERVGQGFVLRVESDDRLTIRRLGEPGAISLKLDGATFLRADSEMACTQWDGVAEGWAMALPGQLPAPGVQCLELPLIRSVGGDYHIGYDILGLTFWMLTRQEEVGREDLDSHGRFPATSSHAFRHDYLERPIVDEWLHILRLVVGRVWPRVVLRQHRFSIKLSHDVDTPSLYGFKSWTMLGRMMLGDLLKRHDLRAFAQAPFIRVGSRKVLHTADPYNTFDWIMERSEAQGLCSAFYFICGRTDASRDAEYEPEHPAIRQLIRRIHARGHEVGLHPSYASYQHAGTIKAEADRLRKIARDEGISQDQWGGRMHYLRWEQPTTLRAWADAGMDYDSTLGYADRPGFRCGTCFEYPAFDPVMDKAINLRIRPLIAMEATIIDPIYLGLGLGQQALERFEALKAACAKVQGCFTLLWHNSSLVRLEQRELYSKVCTMNGISLEDEQRPL